MSASVESKLTKYSELLFNDALFGLIAWPVINQLPYFVVLRLLKPVLNLPYKLRVGATILSYWLSLLFNHGLIKGEPITKDCGTDPTT